MMQSKILKLLKEIVIEVGGSSAEKIVDLLHEKKNVNEFLIAKKLNLTINQTRNILYKLGDEGLVSFIRKKDAKKGGWYTYFWTLDLEKCLIRYRDRVTHDIAALNQQLSNLGSMRFYYCTNCAMEYTEENALLQQYTCPECGEVLVLKNPDAPMNEIRTQIKKKEELLALIQVELLAVQKKSDQGRERKFKAEIKKKAAERAEKRQKAAKERAAKAPKKPVKTKSKGRK